MAEAELIPLRAIVQQLKTMCAQQLRGTVFLVSDDNRMVQVRLDNGEIMQLTHRNRRGLHALAVLSDMQMARLRFDDAAAATAERDDLATKAIFEFLDNAVMKSMPAQATASSSALAVLTAETKSAIERTLVKYIGPMAEIVCADHFESATDLRSLVQSLGREIQNQEQAAKFVAELGKTLKLD